ncbi:hypothetical protein KIPB_010826, partial [Kipferlia bialata]
NGFVTVPCATVINDRQCLSQIEVRESEYLSHGPHEFFCSFCSIVIPLVEGGRTARSGGRPYMVGIYLQEWEYLAIIHRHEVFHGYHFKSLRRADCSVNYGCRHPKCTCFLVNHLATDNRVVPDGQVCCSWRVATHSNHDYQPTAADIEAAKGQKNTNWGRPKQVSSHLKRFVQYMLRYREDQRKAGHEIPPVTVESVYARLGVAAPVEGGHCIPLNDKRLRDIETNMRKKERKAAKERDEVESDGEGERERERERDGEGERERDGEEGRVDVYEGVQHDIQVDMLRAELTAAKDRIVTLEQQQGRRHYGDEDRHGHLRRIAALEGLLGCPTQYYPPEGALMGYVRCDLPNKVQPGTGDPLTLNIFELDPLDGDDTSGALLGADNRTANMVIIPPFSIPRDMYEPQVRDTLELLMRKMCDTAGADAGATFPVRSPTETLTLADMGFDLLRLLRNIHY